MISEMISESPGRQAAIREELRPDRRDTDADLFGGQFLGLGDPRVDAAGQSHLFADPV